MSAGPDPGAELRALAANPAPPFPAERFAGRGIVMCAGGERLLTCAWVTLAFLRRDLGCTLPVELWHLGPEELGPTERALLAELGVTCVDAQAVRREYPARVLGGWEVKPYAVVHSAFAEVVMLDADSLPLVDPATLFDTPGYRGTGAVFWPDVVRLETDNGMWELCGVPYRNEPAWEAGQALIDKERCWHALMLTLFMNMHSDLFYRHSHGDKDTFHLAWRMLDAPVAMTPYPPKVTPSGLTQRGPEGEPLFQHRSTTKWLLHADNQRDPAFRHEERCLQLLDELRGLWTGRIEVVPDRGAADHRREDELAAQAWFTLERRGWDRRTVQLLSAHRVGAGASGEDRRWWVQDGQLVLAGDLGVTCRLAEEDGAWRGRWDAAPHFEVVVRAATPAERDPAALLTGALLDAVAGGELTGMEVAAALATVGRVLDLDAGLARERARWAHEPAVLDLLREVAARAGERDPSLRPHGVAAGHRYGPA